MGWLLLLTLPFLVIATEPVTWYFARGLSQERTDELTKLGCFRGTYGRFDLSIFTCDGYKGERFGELPADAPVCFVELENSQSALSLITARGDARILWLGENEIILTSRLGTNEYPTLSCGSRSDYSGSALNVIRVPRQPFLPRQPLEPLKSFAPDARITNLISQVDASKLEGTVTTLANFYSRNSYAATAKQAVDWAFQQFQQYGFHVRQQTFRSDMCNNIIAERDGTVRQNDIVTIGAHLDSRAGANNDTTSYAPGADDNGSGSASVLELARLLYENEEFKTEHTIRLVLFCGEEQGLLGSDAMAASFVNESKRFPAYYNADMTGWNCMGSGNPSNPLAFMNGSASRELTDECKQIIQEYYPSQPIGDTTACCSDQQSFNKYGIPALGIFECPGTRVVYPYYHSSNDVPSALDYNQVAQFAKGLFACFLTRAIPAGPL